MHDVTLSIVPLETRRLVLLPLRQDDAEQIQRILPHWEIVRYMASVIPWPYPDDGALTYIRDVALPAMERGEQWHWTLRLRNAPQQIIGVASLRAGAEDNRGFWLGVPWQRAGLMSEAAEAVTGYWFDVLQFDVLRVAKAVDNIGSRRISEKSGMRCVGVLEKDYVGGRLASERWEITAREWRDRRSSSG
jgi:ribosomal-protein-alanine N-acetyltransferase